METMTEAGAEKHIEELSKRMDFGLALLAKGTDDLRSEMREGFGRVDTDVREIRSEMRELRSETREVRSDMKAGFDSLQQLMLKVCAGTIGSIVAGVVVLLLSHS